MTTYARALFPGIAKIQSCSVTIGHGITPTGFRIVTTPQPSHLVVPIGPLILEYNDLRLIFSDCRADEAFYRYNIAGQLIELMILDRRWRWRYGKGISGEFNIRRPDGTIQKIDGGRRENGVEDSERTPAELAQLLLNWAGEHFLLEGLADLPTDIRPACSWDNANPMSELQSLAELCNCRVVLSLNNFVYIRRVNVGRRLPGPPNKTISCATAVDYLDSPDVVSLVTGWVRYQHDFELEAVGLDVDGNRKLLDDLSYKPTGGWENSDVYTRYAIVDEGATQNLALQTVFREYRIKVPFDLPGFGPVTRREQLILLASQVYQENDEGIKVDRPAMIYGVWYRDADAQPDNSIASIRYLPDDAVEARRSDDERSAQIVDKGFSIDTERCVVRFGDIVVRQTSATDHTWAPATLRLRTTCYVRDLELGGIQRREFQRVLQIAEKPCLQELIHDEIKPAIWSLYSDTFASIDLKNNDSDIIPEVESYLADAAATFGAVKTPEQAEYGGWIFDCDLDGSIQSITWSLSSKGDAPTTSIQRNQDAGNGGIPYRLRQEYAALRKVKREAAKIEWRQKREAEIARAGKPQ